MKGLVADCRHAIRLYARTPFASLLAVLVLAIGLAFVSSFLSLYVDLVLRPHPGYEDSARIATIGQNTGTDLTGITYEAVERISEEVSSIEAAAMFYSTSVALGIERESMPVSMVSEQFFSGLRPRLALGRGLTIEDHYTDAEPVVVLSYRFWQERFEGDRTVLGTAIEWWPDQRNSGADDGDDSESAMLRIVGVMADSLPNPVPWSAGSTFEPALWLPLERAWSLLGREPAQLRRLGTSGTLARRGPGVSASALANELRARYGQERDLWNARQGAQLDAIAGIVGNSVTHKEAARQLQMFLAASVLLAFVAAANVSVFLLARAPGRRRELGIRMAVGAQLQRLARQLATEAGLLVVAASVLGLLGSIWLSRVLGNLAFLSRAEWRNVTLLDWRVLALCGFLLLLLTLFVSLAPIMGLKKVSIAAASRQVAARATFAQQLVGTTQIAISGLLGGAGIAFAWHLGFLLMGDPGYEMNDRYLAQVFSTRLFMSSDAGGLEAQRWRDAVDSMAGVTSVAFGSPVPGAEGSAATAQIPNPADLANELVVYTGSLEQPFIELLELQLLRGRAPQLNETHVAVVNQTLAQAIWGREDVVGERLPGHARWGDEGAEVIGVLEDMSFGHPSAPARPYAFTAINGLAPIIIETSLSAADLSRTLGNMDTSSFNIRFASLQPLQTIRDDLIAPDRARGFLTIGTAALVVLLAAFGFYGIQRYLVKAGRREYAIRASLGGGPGALGRLVLGRGIALGLPGIALGLLLSFTVAVWLRGDYIARDISPLVVTIAAGFGLISLLMVASFGPAREARRTQPAPLLRED